MPELDHLPSSLCVHLSVATSCYFSLAAHTVTSAELVEVQWKYPGDFLSCYNGLYMGEVTPGKSDLHKVLGNTKK